MLGVSSTFTRLIICLQHAKMAGILTLDYSHFTSGTEEQRRKFIHQILESFTTTGFVKITNHGFDEQQLKEVFGWVRPPPRHSGAANY